jgi:putative transposase
VEFPGALHHVMSRGNDGIAIFRDDDDRLLFLDLLGEEVVRSRWVVHDYCLMENHYHLVIETPETTLSSGMQRFLGRYVQQFNRRHARSGHLVERRFKNILVEKESYLLELTRYLALNPVRAGRVERPEEHAWSSYRARAGLERGPGWLTTGPVFASFAPDPEGQQREYRRFVAAGIEAPRELMDELRAQMYLGSEGWIERIQGVLDAEERSEEHPRAQVHPGRPEMDDVLEAVAQTFDTTAEQIAGSRGTLERRVTAYLAFEEGLVPLRTIARRLGVTSAGGMSSLVARFRRELGCDATLGELVETCRSRMRRRPPPAPAVRLTPAVTARRYHRGKSRSLR